MRHRLMAGVRLMLGIALLLCVFPHSAWAWEQSMTCYEVGEDCEDGLEPYPTFWETPCVQVYLNEDGTDQLEFDQVESIVRTAVDAWNVPESSSLQMYYAGLTNETRVGYNVYTSRNANIIVFRDDAWKEDPSIMALTSVIYRNSSGKIYDADMEINTYLYHFGIVTPRSPKGVIDLQNTITHELGHVVGLDHSSVESATMYPYSTAGVTYMQTLDEDDVEAISTIYPLTAQTECKFNQSGYFERPDCEMGRPCGSDGICSVKMHLSSKKPIFSLALLILVLSLFVVVRRRCQNSKRGDD